MLFQKKRINDGKDTKDLIRIGNERIRSLLWEYCLLTPMDRQERCFSGKVSFCTSVKKMKKASLAVETALVLPMFFLGMITVISFLDVYKVQTEHLFRLCEKVKEAGMYAYTPVGKGPEEITLPDIYSYTPVGGLVRLPKIRLYNTVKVHAWTGSEGIRSHVPDSSDEPEKMVYVTESGNVYHKDADCTYLKLSVSQVSGNTVKGMRNQYGEKYSACETCSVHQNPAGSVYITNTGNKYHNLGTCSGLKRTVMLVKHSHAAGMAVCSRCG